MNEQSSSGEWFFLSLSLVTFFADTKNVLKVGTAAPETETDRR